MAIQFSLPSALRVNGPLTVIGATTLSATTSALVRVDGSGVVATTTLQDNFALAAGTLSLAAALTSINSITSAAGQNLVLGVGTGGAAITVATGTLVTTFTADVVVNGTLKPQGNIALMNGGVNRGGLEYAAASGGGTVNVVSEHGTSAMFLNYDSGGKIGIAGFGAGRLDSHPTFQFADGVTNTLTGVNTADFVANEEITSFVFRHEAYAAGDRAAQYFFRGYLQDTIAGASDYKFSMALNGDFQTVGKVSAKNLEMPNTQTPASATAAGTKGTICWDASYVYVCTATDTWKRAALSSWT